MLWSEKKIYMLDKNPPQNRTLSVLVDTVHAIAVNWKSAIIMTTIWKTFHPSHLFLCPPSLLYSFKTHNISISINMGHLFSISYYPILNGFAYFLHHFTRNDCQCLINLFCKSQIFLYSCLHITPICPKIPQIHHSPNNFHYSIYLEPNLIFFPWCNFSWSYCLVLSFGFRKS